MYKQIKTLCSTQHRASGPVIDAEHVFTDPVLQEDCISCITTVSRKEYSHSVSVLLDRLGYSYDMIKHRQKLFEETDIPTNRHEKISCKRVTTGGKGEGTALYFENDIDSMNIVKDVICADYPQHYIHNDNITLFQTERQETSPGYTRLKLLKLEGNVFVNEIRESLFKSETGLYYLSSQFFTNAITIFLREHPTLGELTATEDTSGPSTPGSNKYLNFDNVTCFRCICPDILERWVSRRRWYGWPSQDTIHEISLLDGHVVPVGLKGSHNMYREWRICYSLAELHLMRSLNETQLKVYILLKKISKTVLNPVCEDMTSYIMKNVVFWMCEANGIDKFSDDLLMDRLNDCIKYLRTCVSENNLPSYMIPDRNLLAERLDIPQRQQLTSLLGDLLHEGGRMLLRCEKLRDAMIVMYKIPDICTEIGEKRDMIESLLLMRVRIAAELLRPEMSVEDTARLLAQNRQYHDIQTHICQLIQFDMQALRQMGKSDDQIGDLLNTRLKQLLS